MTTLDLRNIEGTRCFCDESATPFVRSIVENSKLSDIHYLGSGDYHYVSLFELERIREPFFLLLFDNHSDAQKGALDSDMLSCGNWVLYAQKLPMFRGICHPKAAEDRIKIPPECPVYISIDLDALSSKYAETNWDQGELSTDDICKSLMTILPDHRIIGADICGSPAGDFPSKLNERTIEILSDIIAPYISKTAEE